MKGKILSTAVAVFRDERVNSAQITCAHLVGEASLTGQASIPSLKEKGAVSTR